MAVNQTTLPLGYDILKLQQSFLSARMQICKGTVQNVGWADYTSGLQCMLEKKAHFLETKLYIN